MNFEIFSAPPRPELGEGKLEVIVYDPTQEYILEGWVAGDIPALLQWVGRVTASGGEIWFEGEPEDIAPLEEERGDRV
jgi:hypothetical protein